ncbi:coilin isoform X2 [Perognathus longimembris pacificus]|uniref:coilin isoform X2 n=1 Tax=Perognathus longimembris pacificus TaxID=214514 RepID=UPI0020193581|nr:coilin isoform X2 [Perognathus longimembris pacificus]
MAATETVRLRLQFDYPPPATPHCTIFWLLVDLNRCRVVTDLISLVRHRFGFSSGALLGLYLDGGLLPPTESARVVRDNDCLRVKLEEREILEDPVVVRNGGDFHSSPRKAKKRTLKLVEDEETDLGYRYSRKPWKRQKNSSNHEKALDLEPKAGTDRTLKKKNKRRNKAPCGTVGEQEEETKRTSPRKKEKCEYKKQIRNPKSSEWSTHNINSPKSSSSLAKARQKGGVVTGPKVSPGTSSESESSPESSSDVTLVVGNSLDKLSAELSKEGPTTKNPTVNKVAVKTTPNLPTSKVKSAPATSSSSDSSSESDDQPVMLKKPLDCASGSFKTAGLFAGRGCPGPGQSSQAANAMGWKPGDSNGIRQTPGHPPSVSVSGSLGRGWGRGEPWKGARGRGPRGRGRGRGNVVSCTLHKSAEYQKQQQLSEVVSNSSTIIQNPAEVHKKDYSLLPLLAAAPRIGEKIAFKLLELTADYSPDVSDYKEGKILSHNPETQQVDIEILSSLPDHCVLERVDRSKIDR